MTAVAAAYCCAAVTFLDNAAASADEVGVCRERQELDKLPAEIDNLSVSKAALEKRLMSLSQQSKDSHQQAADIGHQLASLEAKIDAKTERWLELEDRAEQ